MKKISLICLTAIIVSLLLSGCGRRVEVVEQEEHEADLRPIEEGNTAEYDWGTGTAKDTGSQDAPASDTSAEDFVPEFTVSQYISSSSLDDGLVQIEDVVLNMGGKTKVSEMIKSLDKKLECKEDLTEKVISANATGVASLYKNDKTYATFGYINTSVEDASISDCVMTYIAPAIRNKDDYVYLWYSGNIPCVLKDEWIKNTDIAEYEKKLLGWHGTYTATKDDTIDSYGYDTTTQSGYLSNIILSDESCTFDYKITTYDTFAWYITCEGTSLDKAGVEGEEVEETEEEVEEVKEPETAKKEVYEPSSLFEDEEYVPPVKQETGVKIKTTAQINDEIIAAYNKEAQNYMTANQSKYASYGAFTEKKLLGAFVNTASGDTAFIYGLGTSSGCTLILKIQHDYTMIKASGGVSLSPEGSTDINADIGAIVNKYNNDSSYQKAEYAAF